MLRAVVYQTKISWRWCMYNVDILLFFWLDFILYYFIKWFTLFYWFGFIWKSIVFIVEKGGLYSWDSGRNQYRHISIVLDNFQKQQLSMVWGWIWHQDDTVGDQQIEQQMLYQSVSPNFSVGTLQGLPIRRPSAVMRSS